MKEADEAVRHHKKFKVTTNSHHKQAVFESLVSRQFDVAQWIRFYTGDVTYIWTQEGLLYLVVVIDLCAQQSCWLKHLFKNEYERQLLKLGKAA